MSYSFDPFLPTAKDSVRSILRDNRAGIGNLTTDQVVSGEYDVFLNDEEIAANLANNGWNDGLALCATSMAGECARRASAYKAGSTDAEFQWKERQAFYEKAAELARVGAYPPPSAAVRLVDSAATASYQGRRCVEDELLGGRSRWDC